VVVVPLQEIFNYEFFVEKVLADFDKEHMQDRPKKHSKDIFVYLDNATPHRAPRDFDCLGMTRLIHQLYSPYLALCDFWLFEMLKRKLKGHMFASAIEVNNILMKIPFNDFILFLMNGSADCVNA
jgi:hypothetical protein